MPTFEQGTMSDQDLIRQLIESNQTQFTDLRKYIHAELAGMRSEIQMVALKLGQVDAMNGDIARAQRDIIELRADLRKTDTRLATIENGQELTKLVQRWVVGFVVSTFMLVASAAFALVVKGG